MKKLTGLITITVALHLGCSRDLTPLRPDQTQPIRPLSVNEQYISDAAGNFGLDLFKAISATTLPDEDLFISPLSISMALGMTMNGADSGTYQAMQQTLGFAGLNEEQINKAYKSLITLLLQADPKVIFEIANSIWYRNEFLINPVFLETNTKYFDAEILPANFNDPATVLAINSWVDNKTHGKISEIIDQIDPSTLMFLINAIYFKGVWHYEFDKDKTYEAPFYLADNQTKDCQFMPLEEKFPYYADDKVQVIDLPYGNRNFSMTVFLPRPEQDLSAFIASLNTVIWQNYIGHLDSATVSLQLPKFKLKYKLTLNKVLSEMGMGVAFTPGQADFSRILDSRELFISKVLHKTFVQVDEEGTEAAAVTAVEISFTSVQPGSTITMRVDHPFFFAIRERQSGTILFLGKILKPVWSEN